jgi:DUF1365 family protein
MTASALYLGKVGHHRRSPREHRLEYRVFSLLLDLDELPTLDARLRLFSHNRFGLLSVLDRDHGPGDGAPLAPYVRTLLAEAGVADADGPIRLLCYPRVLGYVFNPLSVYYCYRRDGRLRALVYEVNNTFGERHSYLIPVVEDDGTLIHQACDKAFYVSPFLPMNCTYYFRVQPPGERLSLAIHETHDGQPILDAWLTARRTPLTDAGLLRAIISMPLLTLKVTAGIHWEAFKLWRKGIPLFRHRRPPRRAVSLITPDER